MDAAKNSLSLCDIEVPDRLRIDTLELPRGAVIGLVGPNGAGKSTLLQVAAGLIPPGPRGVVKWGDDELGSLPMLERGRRAAWVPQDVQFEFGFSVHAVVGQGRFAHGDDAAGVDAALASLDLSGLATRAVNQLSGGERERVLLARALVTDAPLQLWDEPLAALDPRHALKVLALARQRAQEGATVLLSLHDLRLAHSLDSIVILHRGRLRAFGAPEDVFESNLLREVFGVETRMEPGLTFSL